MRMVWVEFRGLLGNKGNQGFLRSWNQRGSVFVLFEFNQITGRFAFRFVWYTWHFIYVALVHTYYAVLYIQLDRIDYFYRDKNTKCQCVCLRDVKTWRTSIAVTVVPSAMYHVTKSMSKASKIKKSLFLSPLPVLDSIAGLRTRIGIELASNLEEIQEEREKWTGHRIWFAIYCAYLLK